MGRSSSFVALLVLCCPLGCAVNPAIIHYQQVGACIRAQTGTGPITAPPAHAVVVFRVTSIDNTKINTSWAFDSTALKTNSDNAQQNLGGTGLVTIPANQVVAVNALVGILSETSNADGSDAAETNYFLVYPSAPPAPGTVAAKGNSGQTKYPFAQDCNAIARP